MTRIAQRERTALADLLEESGPDAPTLCDGWTTRDLAAHLVLREGSPANVGILVKGLAGWTARTQQKIANGDYLTTVARFRQPPWWAPLRYEPLNELANLMEHFIHIEDIRRAAPGWSPRDLPADEQAALWTKVGFASGHGLRPFPAAITLTSPGHGEHRTGSGGPAVTITGAPGELLMFCMGRQSAADVQLAGPDELVAQLRGQRLGI